MPHNKDVIPKSARLPKVKNLNDLLARDDINGILADLNKRKPDITDMIVIYYNKKTDRYGWQMTENTHVFFADGLLDAVKGDLLVSEDEEG